MTQEEWIKKFTEELNNATNKEKKLNEIKKIIESLCYTKDHTPVPDTYKLAIWEGIEKNLKAFHKSFSNLDSARSTDSVRICEATDNSEIIKMLGDIENKLRRK